MMGSVNFMKFIGIVTAVMLCFGVIQTCLFGAEEKEPEKGIKIILNVYSGRPNPQMWLTEGPEFDKLVGLLKELKAEEKKLFKYSKWNQLGYTSMWIVPKNLENLPYAVHLWHDEASVVEEKGKTAKHATGAMPIYEMLAEKALKTEQTPKKFFQRYSKAKAEKEKKEK